MEYLKVELSIPLNANANVAWQCAYQACELWHQEITDSNSSCYEFETPIGGVAVLVYLGLDDVIVVTVSMGENNESTTDEAKSCEPSARVGAELRADNGGVQKDA